MSEELTKSDSQVRKKNWTASNETQLKKAMSNKFINLKTSKYEITELQYAQAASKFMQNRKLSHHINLFQLYKFHSLSEQDECF